MTKKINVNSNLEPMNFGAKKIILALQHLIAMFGATVLVPILTGFDSSVALFTAGCGTLIFHLSTKGKVPVFLGSSFAFIPVILSVNSIYGDIRYAQGGMMVAGLIYVLISFLVKKIDFKIIEKYLGPQVIGPMIMVIGLNLIPTAYNMMKDNMMIALVTLFTALIIERFGKGFFRQLSTLIGVLVGYFLALGLKEVDIDLIRQAQVFAMPNFTSPKFDLGAIMIISPIVLAVIMEHMGDIITNGYIVGEDFIKDPGLDRTLLGDGLATTFASLLGGPANTTYGENTGVLAITKNYDPSIIRLAAIFAIVLGFVSKLGAVMRSIPVSVMGGISIRLFFMIALVGFKTLRNSNIKANFKNTLVIAAILILGFGSSYIEDYFNISLGIKISQDIRITGLSFAAIVGIILNGLLNIKTSERKKDFSE